MNARNTLLGIGLALAAGVPAALLAIENALTRALVMLAAGVAFYLLGVYTPVPNDRLGRSIYPPPDKKKPPNGEP